MPPFVMVIDATTLTISSPLPSSRPLRAPETPIESPPSPGEMDERPRALHECVTELMRLFYSKFNFGQETQSI